MKNACPSWQNLVKKDWITEITIIIIISKTIQGYGLTETCASGSMALSTDLVLLSTYPLSLYDSQLHVLLLVLYLKWKLCNYIGCFVYYSIRALAGLVVQSLVVVSDWLIGMKVVTGQLTYLILEEVSFLSKIMFGKKNTLEMFFNCIGLKIKTKCIFISQNWSLEVIM